MKSVIFWASLSGSSEPLASLRRHRKAQAGKLADGGEKTAGSIELIDGVARLVRWVQGEPVTVRTCTENPSG